MQFKKTLVALALCAASHSFAQTTQRTPREIAYSSVMAQRDPDTAIVKAKQFLHDYPMTPIEFSNDKREYVEYYKVYLGIITHSHNADSTIRAYYNELPYYTVSDIYHHRVEIPEANKLAPPEKLIDMSTLMMKKLEAFRVQKPMEFRNMPDSDWTRMSNRDYYSYMLSHIRILRQLGQNEEGLRYAKMAREQFGYKGSTLNEDDVLLLLATNQPAEAQTAMEGAVNENQATPSILDALKKNYIAKNGSDKGFDAYVESLKSAEGKAEMMAEMKKSMLNHPIPAFALHDQYGKLIDTKDWKGKVVVLDFFASWCAPCKASFPGMKMAQQRFTEDKNVLFYFIDTEEEHNPNYKQYVEKYIKDNDFPFHILYDRPDKKPDMNNYVANLLGVSAIPRKMILDGNGHVRFDMDGYYGSPTKLADEVTMMINLTKQAN